jgi:photosystem II stability/assembly factor-like uncharacterized protein
VTPAPFPTAIPSLTPRVEGSTHSESITAITAHGDSVWIAADDTIMASTDGGAHWSQLASIEAVVSSLSFASAESGWAGTSAGLLRSNDGGATWQATAVHDGVSRVRFVDPKHGWILTKDGSLSRTADGGASWTEISNPCQPGPGNEFASMGLFSFIDGGTGWILCPGQPSAGSQGKDLFHTEDGGETWALLSSAGFNRTSSGLPVFGYAGDLFFLDDQHGWMSVDHYGVLATDDGARSWRLLPFIEEGPPLGEVVFPSLQKGFAVSSVGAPLVVVVVATRDGGRSGVIVYTEPTPVPTPARTAG